MPTHPAFINAGSEYALHQTLRGLVGLGHQATVALTRGMPCKPFVMDGVKVVSMSDVPKRFDVVLTQLFESVPAAVQVAREADRPLVYYSHTNHGLRGMPCQPMLAISNAKYLAAGYQGRHLVFHPPVDPDEYETPRRRARYITRIGLSPQKGGHLFWRLAQEMPGHEFLGVVGGWGGQVAPRLEDWPQNVRVYANTPDIKHVYAETRVLLMPSDLHETWGRIAVEAAASGIPTIATPIPGLVESLGDAGIYCHANQPHDWVETIKCLDNKRNYLCHSRAAKRRSAELRPDFHVLEDALYDIPHQWMRRLREARPRRLTLVEASASSMGRRGRAATVAPRPADQLG